MLKNIFMGTPDFAAICLEKLVKSYGPPIAVITQAAKPKGRGKKVQPSEVEQFAQANNIPVFPTENVNNPEYLRQIEVFKPDLILVAAFGQLLKEQILNMPRLFCLNVHGSLLPEFRGAAPIQHAIWEGKTKTGITIQKIVKKMDAGDILLKSEIDILPEETAGELFDRLAVLGGKCLVEAVRKVESGDYELIPQDPARVTFASKIDRSASPIDWSQGAKRIFNQIRALNPWPVAETHLDNIRLKVYRASLNDEVLSGSPGDILTDSKGYIKVICGDNKALSLTEIQLENKKRLDVRQFLAAYKGNFPYQKMGNE